MGSGIDGEVARLLECAHPDPHALLGAHAVDGGVLVRVLKPGASAVAVRTAAAAFALAPSGPAGAGLFTGVVPIADGADYRLLVTYPPGRTVVVPDGYRMAPGVSETDLRAFADGTHRRLWEMLGARPTMMGTPTGAVAGTVFSVWAPRALGVSVIGDFDGWTGLGAPMRRLGASGVWEVFVPGVGPGELYKFRIRTPDGGFADHADPLARSTEPPPKTASRVARSRHEWRDGHWAATRAATDPRGAPMSIYEVHLGSWRPGLDYTGLADELVPYVARLGFTHVELLPVTEHPYGGSWGYQVTSYFAPTARFGAPDGLRLLVDRFHTAGIAVIADWVPAHFPRDGWALARFDGAPLYEPSDPLRADHPDWGTLTFDLERPQVRSFLISSALYLLESFHLDGLRVDAVASMLYRDYSRGPRRWRPHPVGGREDLTAVAFLRELTTAVARLHPDAALIAEDSSLRRGTTTAPPSGGLGFTLRWNLGWMHDTLGFLSLDAADRRTRSDTLPDILDYAWDEAYVLAIGHDEVVHSKRTPWARIADPARRGADVAALLALMWAHPGKKLLFMGQEFAQETEWSDVFGPDWAQIEAPVHAGIRDLTARLNSLYTRLGALWAYDCSPDGLTLLTPGCGGRSPAGAAFAFARTAPGHAAVVCAANFSDEPASVRPRPVQPRTGGWRIAIDTNGFLPGACAAAAVTGREGDPEVRVPAHSTVWLVPDTCEDLGPPCRA